MARQEKIRIAERTRAGLARAKRAGKQLGRPRKIRPERVRELRGLGLSWSAIAKELNIAIDGTAIWRIMADRQLNLRIVQAHRPFTARSPSS